MSNVKLNKAAQLRTGERRSMYELEFDEQELAVYFIFEGERCNEFFSFDDWDDERNDFLLVNMFSPEPRIGLGRDALQYFIAATGGNIHVRDRWMTDSSDGSHVLPDAWPFVERMMAEGLIIPHSEPDEAEFEENSFNEF